MRLTVENKPLAHYVDLLTAREPFAFSRWGDAEWMVVFGNREGVRNSNGCTFTRELTLALRSVLTGRPNYYLGLLAIARRTNGDEIERWLAANAPGLRWVKGDVVLNAVLAGQLSPLTTALRQHRIVYVGPEHCRRLPELGFMQLVGFVQPPPRDCIRRRAELAYEILEAVMDSRATFVGFSAGLGGKAILDDVWRATGGEVTLFDFGSTWDGFCGVPSRSYIRRGHTDWPALLKANLPGRNDE